MKRKQKSCKYEYLKIKIKTIRVFRIKYMLCVDTLISISFDLLCDCNAYWNNLGGTRNRNLIFSCFLSSLKYFCIPVFFLPSFIYHLYDLNGIFLSFTIKNKTIQKCYNMPPYANMSLCNEFVFFPFSDNIQNNFS